MKILSKIKRRADGDALPHRGEYVEMELYDTDRKPLDLTPPSGGGAIQSKSGFIGVPSTTWTAPWHPFPLDWRMGIPIDDPTNEWLANPVDSSDASARRFVIGGSFLLTLNVAMHLQWPSPPSTYNDEVKIVLNAFKYDSGGLIAQTIAHDVQEFHVSSDEGYSGSGISLAATGQFDVDAGTEIGAQIITMTTGGIATSDIWAYPESAYSYLYPTSHPIQARLTRLGDHA